MDNVEHPSHYTSGGIECIDAIRASLGSREFDDYCKVEWRDFPRHPKYEVSNLGGVRRKDTKRERKCVKIKNGYMTVLVVEGGKYVLEYVHRAVAEAFIPNMNSLPQVNHKDRNRENNRVDNLEWCSAAENVQYSLGIPIEQIDDRGNVVRVFNGVREAERFYGVPHGSIDRAARGEYKKAYGFRWRYRDE